MRRLGLTLALLFLLIAARSERAVTLQANDTAHCTADVFVATSPVDVRCAAFTATPVPVATSTATATATPVPATATATATSTSVPEATATPNPVGALPLCPTHDPTQWHALVDTARNCHYDHEHGDDPHLADAVFGPPPGGNQTISFPWETSSAENVQKHGGYKWFVLNQSTQPCELNPAPNDYPFVDCITDARVEIHFIGATIDALARYHSFYAEYRICKNNGQTTGNFVQCGIFKTGGWADIGILGAPYAGYRIFRPGGTIDFGMGSLYGGGNQNITLSYPADLPDLDSYCVVMQLNCPSPYWFSPDFASITRPGFFPENVIAMNPEGQYNRTGHNRYAGLVVRIADGWDSIDLNSPNTLHFFCRDGSCSYNASLRELAETGAFIPAAWDADGNGFADKSGFTDRFGEPVTGCTAPALDCVPFSVVNVPVSTAYNRDPNCECNRDIEYDTAPAGQHWIQFPN